MPETPSAKPRKIALVVLGMHRSGTSAVTRLLSLAGATLPATMMGPSADNPTGFWEPADVVNISDSLMKTFDSHWDDIFAGVAGYGAAMAEQALQDTAVRILAQNYKDADLIVLKDPRVAVLMPFWSHVLETAGYSPRYIIMVRNPLEVAASLAARNGFSREKALLLWSSYMVAAERDTRNARRTFITFDALLSDWRGVLDKVEKDLGVALPRRSGAASVETDRFLQGSLRHHIHTRPLEEQGRLWAPVRTLYDWFSATAEGKTIPNVAPDQVGEQLGELHNLFGPVVAELQIDIESLNARLADKEREVAEALSAADALKADQAEHLARLSQEVEQLTAALAEARERFNEDAVALAASVSGRRTLESELVKLAQSSQELQQELDAGRAHQDELDAQLQARTAEHEALVAERSGLEATIGELQALNAVTARELEESRKVLAQTMAGFEALQVERNELMAERSTLNASIESMRQTYQRTMAETDALLEARSAQHAALVAGRTELEATIFELRAFNASIARQLDDSRNLLEQSTAGLEALQVERDALSHEREAWTLERQAYLDTVDTLRRQAIENTAIISDAEQSLAALRQERDVLLLRAEELSEATRAHASREEHYSAMHQRATEARDEARAELERVRRENQNLELMVDETRMAAALESRTLRRHLHEQTEALRAANEDRARLLAAHNAVTTSTSWRITSPLRRALQSRRGLATTLRTGLKLVYWTATLQLAARLRRRAEFLAQHAATDALAASVQPPAIAPPAPARPEEPAKITVFKYPTAAPAPEVRAEPSRRSFYWQIAEAPHTPAEALGLYDRRPDDAIPREAERGRLFMERFELLSAKPRFHEAVQYLNARRLTALRPGSAARPQVSIIIPVYGQLAYTLNCLDSLLDHESAWSFEILIGDDVSPDDSGDFLPLLDGVKSIRHEKNGGFVLNCNWTAAAARGDYVVFLNNDTRVAPHWLDEMMGSFALFPKAGLVGSKLFYPDGVLQEAGGIVWRDGSAWNYGRDQDPNRPEFCYARQVDYISGASIALPRALWNELGGFDELYKPAYCEDLDLALRVRSIGLEVWLQPLSRVIHYEGRTSGTDTGQGVKAYQVTNLRKVFERWSATLASHRPNAEEPLLEKDRNVQKRALVIDVGTPTPDQDAGSVVTVATLKIYQDLGYKVTFLPRDNFLFDPVYTQQLQRMGIECIYAPYEINFAEFLKRQGRYYDVIQVFRPGVAEQCVPDIRTHAPQAPIIYHNVDLHYLRMQRQAEVDNDAALRAAAAEMKTRELAIMRTIDCMIVISPVEQEILHQEAPGVPIVVFPYITDVVGTTTGFNTRRDIMFLGGFRHPPNTDAAEWLLTDIWPRIAEALPEANLLIVGPEAPEHISAFASDRINVTGMAPELRPYFDRTRVFVAPIRYGAGVKGKVATALAHGVPVVATSCAAEGMYLVNERDLIIADDAAEIAQHVLNLYRDEEEWQRLSTAGVVFVEQHNSEAVGRRVILETIDKATEVRARNAAASALLQTKLN